jgi:FG-GAP-like repeat/Secretion system C-terminal sorting domain
MSLPRRPLIFCLLIAFGLCVHTTNAHAGWYKHVIAQGHSGTRSVFATDMDQDGDIDIVGAARYDNLIGWWEQDGPGIWIEHIITTDFEGAWDVHAADIDNDGNMDILGAAMTAGQVAWWQNTPRRWQQQIISDWFPYAKGVYAADFNGDGLNDILACSYGQSRVTWAENNGGTWTEHILTTQLWGVRAVHAADLDRDGDTEILAAADSAGIAYWDNDNGSFVGQLMPETIWGARAVHAADLTGDEHLEILAASSRFDMILYWQYDPDEEEWVSTIVSDSFVFANDVYAGDLDGDGDVDILGGTYETDRVTWWENIDRNGTWVEHDVSHNANGTRSVFVADVDGDGDNDILAACAHLRQIAWWENEPQQALTLQLEPEQTPVIIPHTGGTISYTMHFTSILNAPMQGQIFGDIRYPDGETEETDLRDTVMVNIGLSSYPGEVSISDELPAGDYQLLIGAGENRDQPLVLDSLQFTKEIDTAVHESSVFNADEFSVSAVYPNPFNGSTSISVRLPITSELKVVVTDILGRKVLEPVSGEYSAGSHTFSLNLSEFPSGIYLVNVSVPGRMTETRKIVLTK